MKFLVPIGGVTDPDFGILTTYKHKGIPVGIRAGLDWAADNCAFGANFDVERFLQWLPMLLPYHAKCLFVVVPDVVGNCGETLARWHEYKPRLTDWPLAFVCQDGQLPWMIPLDCQAIFIGGTTGWKLSSAAIDCIRWGRNNNKRIHIGRVNWKKRYDHFRALQGSEYWTCDGTRTRFEGVEKTLKAWKMYMQQKPLTQLV